MALFLKDVISAMPLSRLPCTEASCALRLSTWSDWPLRSVVTFDVRPDAVVDALHGQGRLVAQGMVAEDLDELRRGIRVLVLSQQVICLHVVGNGGDGLLRPRLLCNGGRACIGDVGQYRRQPLGALGKIGQRVTVGGKHVRVPCGGERRFCPHEPRAQGGLPRGLGVPGFRREVGVALRDLRDRIECLPVGGFRLGNPARAEKGISIRHDAADVRDPVRRVDQGGRVRPAPLLHLALHETGEGIHDEKVHGAPLRDAGQGGNLGGIDVTGDRLQAGAAPSGNSVAAMSDCATEYSPTSCWETRSSCCFLRGECLQLLPASGSARSAAPSSSGRAAPAGRLPAASSR